MWFVDPATGSGAIRHRRRDDRPDRQRDPALRVFVRLPLVPPPHRRTLRRDLEAPRAKQAVRLRELPEPRSHAVGLVQLARRRVLRHLRAPLLDGRSGPTGGSSDGGVPDHDARRPRRRGRRRGTPRGHRGGGGGRVGRARLQVAPREGAHRDGRRRRRRRARQRRRPRQLEGPLRRHDARRPVRQQLADGRAARAGSAGARQRARSVGRGLRSHEGRPHPAAELRRPPLPASRARRRPDRASR